MSIGLRQAWRSARRRLSSEHHLRRWPYQPSELGSQSVLWWVLPMQDLSEQHSLSMMWLVPMNQLQLLATLILWPSEKDL